ncbi:hypothetical protein DdX_12101 [Ditylenchus destructor]|uniref:Uncharacterized protein n=1 Tax=Ditylenchus destructor TaxID=166010 RepID=A0AAD4MVX5_9BILA|nr:hypothetical protein DdX_12101 [Ditylenchus destructor]
MLNSRASLVLIILFTAVPTFAIFSADNLLRNPSATMPDLRIFDFKYNFNSNAFRFKRQTDMFSNMNLGQEPRGEHANTNVISGLNVNGLGWFSGRAKVDRHQELLQHLLSMGGG